MLLHEKITSDLKEALRSGDKRRVDALRYVLAQLQNKAIELKVTKGSGLIDDETIGVLKREVKKRKEAIELFLKSGRDDLVEKEKGELSFIEKYLPEQLSDEEIESEILKAIESKGTEFSSVMKEAMSRLRGKADGGRVSEMVRRRLEGL